jgi:hypothetical protein
VAPHQPGIEGPQQIRRRSHTRHDGVKSQVIGIQIKNDGMRSWNRRRYSAGRRSEVFVHESEIQRDANNVSDKEKVRRICSGMKSARFWIRLILRPSPSMIFAATKTAEINYNCDNQNQ